MTLQEKFAANLRRVRLSRKLSQEALGRKADVCTSYISMLERGQRSPPLETLEGLAVALGTTPQKLIA